MSNIPTNDIEITTEKGSCVIPLGEKDRLRIKRSAGCAFEDFEAEKVRFESSDPEILSVDKDGTVTARKNGTVVVTAITEAQGESRSFPLTLVSGIPKSRPTLYTREKIEIARENIFKYDWAKEECDRAVKTADKYVGKEELLWHMVTPQELPRASALSARADTNTRRYCPICKMDIMTGFGHQPWIIDPFNDPWKIKCPNCGSRFPSNDFEKFYLSGIDENGRWNICLAKEKGGEYLKNELYPDLGDHAFTDDGFGYYSGKTLVGDVPEIKPFIAYYNYFGLWAGTGCLMEAIKSLSDAYIYTGDIRYGRTGAILLDRIADVYPDMDLEPYSVLPGSDGVAKRGKVLGRIADNSLIYILAPGYDKLYTAFEDSKVVSFLHEKAIKYRMKNPKSCPSAIRMNIDNNILRETYTAVKDGRINGNWGYYQLSLAEAAVVLDGSPETEEMIEWLFKSGTSGIREVTGGNIYAQLLDTICRDGLGNEASFSYNSTWISTLLNIAMILKDYDRYPKANLFRHPKIKRMIYSACDHINIGRTVPNIGDTTTAFSMYLMPATKSSLIEAWCAGIWDEELAQTLYRLNNRTVEGLRCDLFTKDPEKIQEDVLKYVDKKKSFKDISRNFSGYGLMMLRDGFYEENECNSRDTRRGFWIYYGRNSGHGHKDKLNLGGYAYGLDIIPDLGNPTSKTPNPQRLQWDAQPIAHNTVVVNEGIRDKNHITNASQNRSCVSDPLHFDDAGNIKVMDVQAPEVFDAADIYRRTLVSVDADETVSYAVDFFRVKGGYDHAYCFHAQSNDVTVENTELIEQGKGTYAGEDVPWGPDPLTVYGEYESPLKYPPGYTWMYDVKRAMDPKETIEADFKITDFRSLQMVKSEDLHLRLTMLNENASELSEVAITSFQLPRSIGAPEELKKVLLRRKGENLDTLFTAVIEPYDKKRYISRIEEARIKIIDGTLEESDRVRGVKVTLQNGRIDYIVYSTNNGLLVRVDDRFDFRGFIGVYSVHNQKVVTAYVNDGDVIGDRKGIQGAVTGEILDFSRDLTDHSVIEIKINEDVDPEIFENRYIYVDNGVLGKGEYNSCYYIKKAETLGDRIRLHLGNSSLIRGYIDNDDFSKGYLYYIDTRMKFRIPLSYKA
jgi:hypothetical protein